MSNKEKYIQLCEEKEIPLFMQAWWMDAVCQDVDSWDVLLFEKESQIQGVLVYHWVKKFGAQLILQPVYAQFNGVWIDYPKRISLAKKCKLEEELMSDLITQLEQKRLHYFNQNFHYSITNWTPFKKNQFSSSVRYTYVLEDISKPEKVYKAFTYAKQKHIKKSEGKLVVDLDLSAADFYDFHANSLAQNRIKIAYSKELFMSIYNASMKRNVGQIMSIRDSKENLHAALFVVWDKQSAYYLISAINPTYKSSGASTLMVWEAIKFLSDKTKIFDFEGSMIENVAKSFKAFGATKKLYVNLTKNYSFIFKLLMLLKRKK